MAKAARLNDPIGHSPSMNWLVKGLLIGGAGSGNVYINGRPAVRAHLDKVACDKHSGTPPIATGSSKVFINGLPAARVGDKTGCGGDITDGSGDVFIGGGTLQTDVIHPEDLVPGWVHATLFVVGAAAAVVLAGPVVATLGLVGGLAGGAGGGWLGGSVWGEGSDGQKWAMLGGSLVGGAFGAKGGVWFNKNYVVATEGLGANSGNIRIVPRGQPPQSVPCTIRLNQVRSSQGDVSWKMRDGKTISDVADGMRANGWDHSKPPPEMVAYPDGRVVTLDHRRLVAADKAGIEEVPARVHAADESMPPSEARRFALKTEFADPETGQTYFKGDLPTNWGEAAKFRSANQRAMGFPDFPIEGRPGLPPIRAPK